MNYTKEETMTIIENLLKFYERNTDDMMEVELSAMIKAFQTHLKGFENGH